MHLLGVDWPEKCRPKCCSPTRARMEYKSTAGQCPHAASGGSEHADTLHRWETGYRAAFVLTLELCQSGQAHDAVVPHDRHSDLARLLWWCDAKTIEVVEQSFVGCRVGKKKAKDEQGAVEHDAHCRAD